MITNYLSLINKLDYLIDLIFQINYLSKLLTVAYFYNFFSCNKVYIYFSLFIIFMTTVYF